MYPQKMVYVAIQDQYENRNSETRTFHNDAEMAEAPVVTDDESAFVHDSLARGAGTRCSGSRLDSWPKLINSF